jgi:hypothetical protein
LQSTLVIAETAIGLVLLVGAGLLIRSIDRFLNADPDFSPQHMLTFRLAIPEKRFTVERRKCNGCWVSEELRRQKLPLFRPTLDNWHKTEYRVNGRQQQRVFFVAVLAILRSRAAVS